MSPSAAELTERFHSMLACSARSVMLELPTIRSTVSPWWKA